LVGGVTVMNPMVRVPGTLGFLAEDAAGAAWLVSCHHVLGASGGVALRGGEPVMQGDLQAPVAETVLGRADAQWDVVAARLLPGVPWLPEVLGIGELEGVTLPTPGMRVIKSGRETGVTEGMVVTVTDKEVTIGLPTGFPADYELSSWSDSGAVWVERASRKLIGVHRAGDPARRLAWAVPADVVLATLSLRLP
jgi:hypothetical protein